MENIALIFIICVFDVKSYNVGEYFKEKNINPYTKSVKGWIRVLNSKEKRKKYHINLDKKTLIIYKKELKKKL